MSVLLHHLEDTAKDLEVAALTTLERMREKEWDDRPEQVAPSPHAKGCSIAMIAPDDSTAEKLLQRVQQLNVALVLHDGELRKHLAMHPHVGMNRDSHMKTAFTVHETYNPFCLEL